MLQQSVLDTMHHFIMIFQQADAENEQRRRLEQAAQADNADPNKSKQAQKKQQVPTQTLRAPDVRVPASWTTRPFHIWIHITQCQSCQEISIGVANVQFTKTTHISFFFSDYDKVDRVQYRNRTHML